MVNESIHTHEYGVNSQQYGVHDGQMANVSILKVTF